MRCHYCTTLTSSTLPCNGPSIPFHSFADLEAAARQGCETCAVLFCNSRTNQDANNTRVNRYAQLRDSSERLLLRWTDESRRGHTQRGRGTITLYSRNSWFEPVASASVRDCADEAQIERLRLSNAALVRLWIDDCEDNHIECRAARQLRAERAVSPARLVDLRDMRDYNTVRLMKHGFESVEYATLSYRWTADVLAAATTDANLDERLSTLSLHGLPQVYLDVFDFCISLGIYFVWIDALCIVQPSASPKNLEDSDSDWQSQSAIMGDIYDSSQLTIAAAPPSDTLPNPSLYPSRAPYDLPAHSAAVYADSPDGIHIIPHQVHRSIVMTDLPLLSRGWVLQERNLSHRLVYFTQFGLYFECIQTQASEYHRRPWDANQTTTLDALPALRSLPIASVLSVSQKGNLDAAWYYLMRKYPTCHLSVPTDRLPAVSALARRMALSSGDIYLAGLWQSNIMSSLLWRGEPHALAQRSRAKEFVAPTWSWASVVGPVTATGSGSRCPGELGAMFVGADVEPVLRDNVYGQVRRGSCVRVAAYVRRQVRVEESRGRRHAMYDQPWDFRLIYCGSCDAEEDECPSSLRCCDHPTHTHKVLAVDATICFDAESEAQAFLQNDTSHFTLALIKHDLKGDISEWDWKRHPSRVAKELAGARLGHEDLQSVVFEGLVLVPAMNGEVVGERSADSAGSRPVRRSYSRVGWIQFYDDAADGEGDSAGWRIFEGCERQVVEIV